ncbi:MAG: Rieske 2Fe-2S domain-containing protein, partial [Candidatus Thiodiazotropha sp.]
MKKYMRICNLDEIPINGMRTFDAEDGSKILVANYGECHYAYSNICPHQGTCLSEGFYDGAILTCRKHLWQWDITTGKPVGIADSPLENYLVKIEDSEIFVRQASTLRQAQLFTDISSSTQAKLEHLTRYEEYDHGSVLYEIGDPA